MANKIHRLKRTRGSGESETSALQKMQAMVIELQKENRDLTKQLALAHKQIEKYEDELEIEPADSFFEDDDDDDDSEGEEDDD